MSNRNVLRRRSTYIVFVLLSVSVEAGDVAPKLVYGTYLGGRDKECSTGIAVDRSGAAYVVGRTPSPDFPVTPGAFDTTARVHNNDWIGFVSKLSERGDQLLYSTFLGGNFRSTVNAVSVDSAGHAYVAGSTCSANFPTTRSAVLQKAPGSNKTDACDGFVAWLSHDGSRLEYATYLGGSREDAATAVALAMNGSAVYVAGYTFSPDFPTTPAAAQPRLNGSSDGFFAAIDSQTGRLLYSTYLGGKGNSRVTSIAVSEDGKVYVAGNTDSRNWSNAQLSRVGVLGGTDGFIVRIDPTGKEKPYGILIGGAGDDSLNSLAVDSAGDIYAAGSTNSSQFPGNNSGQVGSGIILKISGRLFAERRPKPIWSRRLGGHGEDVFLSVSGGMPGSVFASGRSGSRDFPTTKDALNPHLQADNDSVLLRLRAEDGQVQFSTFLGGTRLPASWYNDQATGVFANSSGNVYVTGCTLDDRLPVTKQALQPRPRGNSEPFVLRLSFAASQ